MDPKIVKKAFKASKESKLRPPERIWIEARSSPASAEQALLINKRAKQKFLKRDIVILDKESYTKNMSNTIFMTMIFSVILAIMLWSGLVKTVKFSFNKAPVQNAYEVQDVERTQSEKTADLQEKNRQLMDRVRAQMERNRR